MGSLGQWLGSRVPEQSLIFASAVLLSSGVNTFTGIYTGGSPDGKRSDFLLSSGLAVMAAAVLLVAASQSGSVDRAARTKSPDPSRQDRAREELWMAMGSRFLTTLATGTLLAIASLWQLI